MFAENCTYHAKPYDGIKEMLGKLKQEGLYLAVLSNKPDGQTRDVVQTFFGTELFDFVQGQKEGIPRKPDPAAVLLLVDMAGVSRFFFLYIFFSGVDIPSVYSAGFRTVRVSWGFRSKEILRETGADVIIDHPEELTAIVTNRKSEEGKHGRI